MPRFKRIKILGYFSDWGSLGGKNRRFDPIKCSGDIISRLENIENVPRKSLWHKHVHLLLLYSNNLDWSIENLCKLFSLLKRLDLQFPEIILRHYSLLTSSKLNLSQSLLVFESLFHNSLKIENLSTKLIKDIENTEHDWKFDELSILCYFINKLNFNSKLFDKLKEMSQNPIFTLFNLEKQLEICLSLGINLDVSKLSSQIDLSKCSCTSLILLIRLGYLDLNILKKRIYQFNCHDMARLSYHLHKKFPEDFVNVATVLISRLTYIYHKLTLLDSYLLLYSLNKTGVTSRLLQSFLTERISYYKMFEPPTQENYRLWLYLKQSLPLNSIGIPPNCYL